MRSGTSNCHVRLGTHPVDSPMVTRPNVLIALNEPSLRKFVHTVEPGGWVLYNATELPEDCRRDDVQTLALPFMEIADHVADARVGNILTLGALLQATHMLNDAEVDTALRVLIKSPKWLELDRKALIIGKEAARKQLAAREVQNGVC
jgi:Pyruvate/2-oxoacid:ferredoxin oxidoreductase gamma subunit